MYRRQLPGSSEDAKIAKETKRQNHYSRDIELACPQKNRPHHQSAPGGSLILFSSQISP
jgi:hypothetical protein